MELKRAVTREACEVVTHLLHGLQLATPAEIR